VPVLLLVALVPFVPLAVFLVLPVLATTLLMTGLPAPLPFALGLATRVAGGPGMDVVPVALAPARPRLAADRRRWGRWSGRLTCRWSSGGRWWWWWRRWRKSRFRCGRRRLR